MIILGYLKKVSCANYLIEIAYYFLHTVLDVVDRTAGLNVGQEREQIVQVHGFVCRIYLEPRVQLFRQFGEFQFGYPKRKQHGLFERVHASVPCGAGTYLLSFSARDSFNFSFSSSSTLTSSTLRFSSSTRSRFRISSSTLLISRKAAAT